MIVISNREMIIPNNERYIGTNYDESSENRQFQLARVSPSGTDLAGMTFTLDLLYRNEGKDSMVLDVDEITDDYIVLTWLITNSQLQVPGTVFAQIRATDSEGTVKWSSFDGTFYVAYEMQTYADYQGDLSELEYYEVQYHVWQAAEADREENEAAREAFFTQLQNWYAVSVEALEDTSIGGMTEVIAQVKSEVEGEMADVTGALNTLENTTIAQLRTDLDNLDRDESQHYESVSTDLARLNMERTFSLPAASWVTATYNSETVYKQEKSALGVSALYSAQAFLSHADTYTKTQWAQAQEAYSTFISNGWAETSNGAVTFYCYSLPAYDFVVKTKGI